MTVQPFDFGELRSLLQQPPSAQVWETLCALVFPAKWEEAAEQWLPYATDHLDRHWPDEQRVLPLKWATRKQPPSALQLARHLRYTGSPDVLASLCKLLERARAPLTIISTANIRLEAAAQLVRAGANPRLHTLQLAATAAEDAGAALLATLDGLATVEALTLNNVQLRDAGLAALLSSPHLPALRRFSMRWRNGGAGVLLADALTTSGLSSQLESLTLSQNKLTDPAALARALARVPWPALTALDLTSSGVEHAGLGSLLKAAPGVRELNLRDNQLDDHAVRAVGAATRLERLDLAYSKAAPSVLAALLEQPCCAGLKALGLRGTQIEEAGHAICRGQIAQTLESLELIGDKQGARFWPALDGARLPNLKVLHLMEARLDSAAARALARAQLPALVEIDLSRATMDADALAALEGASWRPQVLRLWSGHPIKITDTRRSAAHHHAGEP